VANGGAPPEDGRELVDYAVASTAQSFRAVTVRCAPLDCAQSIHLPREAQQALGVAPGDEVVCLRIGITEGDAPCS